MMGIHGLPSCLFGFFTRSTRSGGIRITFFDDMTEEVVCATARRELQLGGERLSRWSAGIVGLQLGEVGSLEVDDDQSRKVDGFPPSPETE